MTTYVLDIDELIEILQEWKKDGYNYVIASNDPAGGWSAPSKKKPFYQVGFAINGKAFEKDDLRNLFGVRGLVIFAFKDTDKFSEKAKQILAEKGGKAQ